MLARGALQAALLISVVAPLAEGAIWFDRLYRKEGGFAQSSAEAVMRET